MHTGILTSHVEFEGRATWGTTIDDSWTSEDLSGYGTHCAGIIASKTWGVAKKVNIIAVKILTGESPGRYSDYAIAINWVINDHRKNVAAAQIRDDTDHFKGSVIHLGVWLECSTMLDYAIEYAGKAEVHVVLPARFQQLEDSPCIKSNVTSRALAVGATDNYDSTIYGYVYSPCTDLFAPGRDIVSTWTNVGTDDPNILLSFRSGASMAAAHVAGLVANMLALQPIVTTPGDLKIMLLATATKDVLPGVPDSAPNVSVVSELSAYI